MKNPPRSRPACSVVTRFLCPLIGAVLLHAGVSRALAASPHFISLPGLLAVASAPSVLITPVVASVWLPAVLPMLAQSDPSAMVKKAVDFLKDVFLVIGCIVIAYGGYEISRGRVVEGLMCIFGGLVLAIAIPLMRWFLQIAAGG